MLLTCACVLEVVILFVLRKQGACIRLKYWRCHTRVTPAISLWRAHVACVPSLRQHQYFSRMLLSQKSNTSIVASPSVHGLYTIMSRRFGCMMSRFARGVETTHKTTNAPSSMVLCCVRQKVIYSISCIVGHTPRWCCFGHQLSCARLLQQ